MRQLILLAAAIAIGGFGCGSGLSPNVTVDPAMLTLVPPDTVALFGVRVDRLRETPVYERLVASRKLPGFGELTDRTGIGPDDLWEILGAYNGADVVIMARGKFSYTGLEPRIEWEGATRETYKGSLIVEDQQSAVSFINATTAVAGRPDRVRALIDLRESSTGPPPALVKLTENIDRSNQIWAVSTGGFTPIRQLQGGSWTNLERVLGRVGNFRAVGNFHSGLLFNATAECGTPEDGETLRSAVKAVIGFARLGLGKQPAMLAVLDTVAVGGEERMVTVDSDVRGELLDDVLAEMADRERP